MLPLPLAVLISSIALAYQALGSTTAGITTAGYDTVYDAGGSSLQTVACSDGPNGLMTKGYTTFSSLPSFPLIAATPNIQWNSPSCGKCYGVSYVVPSADPRNAAKINTVYVIGVDSSHGNGLVLSKAAMNKLTNGQAVQLGRVPVTWEEVEGKKCGM